MQYSRIASPQMPQKSRRESGAIQSVEKGGIRAHRLYAASSVTGVIAGDTFPKGKAISIV